MKKHLDKNAYQDLILLSFYACLRNCAERIPEPKMIAEAASKYAKEMAKQADRDLREFEND